MPRYFSRALDMDRSTIFAVIALIGIVVGGYMFLDSRPSRPGPSAGIDSFASQLPPAATARQEQKAELLVFDVVRIGVDGTGVIAGRAPPRAGVLLFDRGSLITSATANRRGEWAMTIDTPLEPGNAEFTLKARLADGRTIESAQNVSVLVAQRGQKPLVVVTNQQNNRSRVLQHGEGASEGGELFLETIDYGADGRLILSGRSVPRRTIRAYLNNRVIGDGPVRANGRWEIVGREPVAPGDYQLRLDQLDGTGAVRARLSHDFTRLNREFSDAVTIKRGDNLWTIARKVYGRGIRYTLIYEANKNQIRDPDLIYPDQVFSLPGQRGAH